MGIQFVSNSHYHTQSYNQYLYTSFYEHIFSFFVRICLEVELLDDKAAAYLIYKKLPKRFCHFILLLRVYEIHLVLIIFHILVILMSTSQNLIIVSNCIFLMTNDLKILFMYFLIIYMSSFMKYLSKFLPIFYWVICILVFIFRVSFYNLDMRFCQIHVLQYFLNL